MSCTKPQYRKRLFETFHKKRYPFKEVKVVSVFSHFSVSFILVYLMGFRCISILVWDIGKAGGNKIEGTLWINCNYLGMNVWAGDFLVSPIGLTHNWYN